MHMYIYLHVWLLLLLRFTPVWPMNIGEQLHSIYIDIIQQAFYFDHVIYCIDPGKQPQLQHSVQCTHTYISSRCGWDPASFHLNINLYPLIYVEIYINIYNPLFLVLYKSIQMDGLIVCRCLCTHTQQTADSREIFVCLSVCLSVC